MPSVMFRENEGKLSLYIAKKDLEAMVVSLEHDSADKWGGTIVLDDESTWYLDPLDAKPKLPKTLRIRRG
jgi:nitrogen fixation protein NifT